MCVFKETIFIFIIYIYIHMYIYIMAFLIAHLVKNLPQCRRKIPWRRKMANYSNTLVWKIPWTEELGGLQAMGLQRVGHY